METGIFNTSDFFAGISKARKAKKLWLSLAKKQHPKAGGNIEVMQKINLEYFKWHVTNNPKYTDIDEDRDISKYGKILEKNFSDTEWIIFFRHPQITNVINDIIKRRRDFSNSMLRCFSINFHDSQ